MRIADVIADVIIADFLKPTVERLGKQLGRNIHLNVILKIDGDLASREIASTHRAGFTDLAGKARISASDTAISDRYKYNLQCIFDEQSDLEGFSGIRLNGAISLKGDRGKNEYSGYLFSYNEWNWGKKLRDF